MTDEQISGPAQQPELSAAQLKQQLAILCQLLSERGVPPADFAIVQGCASIVISGTQRVVAQLDRECSLAFALGITRYTPPVQVAREIPGAIRRVNGS